MLKQAQNPRRIRLPIELEDELGLGDAIKRLTTAVGIQPCGGCEERAKQLNRLLVLKGRGGSFSRKQSGSTSFRYPDE